MKRFYESAIPYMGNKFKLLPQLIPLFPKECDTFLDLFGGSAVVSMNYKGVKRTIYNEINPNIVALVKMIVERDPDELDKYFRERIDYYGLPTHSTKRIDINDDMFFLARQKQYNKMRADYNKSSERDYRDLYLLICYSVNHLIRFNSNSDFNAPSGNDGYGENNRIILTNMNRKMQNVEIWCENALEMNFDFLTEKDFVYLDVPYLNTEAVYNEKRAFGGWTIESDYALFELLEKLNQRDVKWGLSNVFSNRGKENSHLIDWCKKNGWRVSHLKRNYNPFSTDNSNSDEVYVCNYEVFRQATFFD